MRKSFADMVRSLGLMAVIVLGFLLVGGRQLIFPTASDERPPVDYSDEVQGFAQVAGVPALAPGPLPASFRANAARLFAPAPGAEQLHIGWGVAGARYAGLDEATGNAAALVGSVLGPPGATVRGTERIGAATWQQRTSSRGEPALTRQVGRLTVVITGNATASELRLLAASLR